MYKGTPRRRGKNRTKKTTMRLRVEKKINILAKSVESRRVELCRGIASKDERRSACVWSTRVHLRVLFPFILVRFVRVRSVRPLSLIYDDDDDGLLLHYYLSDDGLDLFSFSLYSLLS